MPKNYHAVGKPYPFKRLFGLAIDHEATNEAPKIPIWQFERWMRLRQQALGSNWNRGHLLGKMVAGMLLDTDSVRYFLTSSSFLVLKQLEDTITMFNQRIAKENRALNDDELKTLAALTESTTTYVNAVNALYKVIRTKRVKPTKKGVEETEIPEVPRFYAQQAGTPAVENGEASHKSA
jgi:hypothetical protein